MEDVFKDIYTFKKSKSQKLMKTLNSSILIPIMSFVSN